MHTRKIVSFLTYPDAQLVEHAVKRANLTKDEWEVIRLREFESKTVEEAAEFLDISPTTVKSRYRSGISKLERCWSCITWIITLTK